MSKKEAPPDAELDADGLVVQKYRSMVLMVVPPREFSEECLRHARSSLYNVHVGTRIVSTTADEEIKGRLQDEFLADGPFAGETMEPYSGLVLAGGEGALELVSDPDVLRLVREADKADKMIGAWGEALAILAQAGVLKGRRVTAPAALSDVVRRAGAKVKSRQLEIDGQLVTASDEAVGMRLGKALATLVGI